MTDHVSPPSSPLHLIHRFPSSSSSSDPSAVEKIASENASRSTEKQTTMFDLLQMAKRIGTWKYMLTDPTLYATLIMTAIEPTSVLNLARWYLLWTLVGAMAVSPVPYLRALAIVMAAANSVAYPAVNPCLKAITQMKSLLFTLRLIQIFSNFSIFANLGSVFTSRYLTLPHDLRRARIIDCEDERRSYRRVAFMDMIASMARFGWALFTFYSLKGTLSDLPGQISYDVQAYLRIMARSYLGAIRLWTFVAMSDAIFSFQLALWGIEAPQTMDKPYMSATIREFFGKRWNLGPGRELSNVFFKPFAKKGHRRLGEFSVFIASVGLHVYLIKLLDGSTIHQLWTLIFFTVMPVFIQLERSFRVQSLAYFHSVMFLFGPLFFEPLFYTLPPF